jgi:hypothetical protein
VNSFRGCLSFEGKMRSILIVFCLPPPQSPSTSVSRASLAAERAGSIGRRQSLAVEMDLPMARTAKRD